MSFHAEQPFHESEQRYFLAEILKVSGLKPVDILQFIQESRVIPDWENIALPNGRSIAACRHQYDFIVSSAASTYGAISQSSPTGKGKKKRVVPNLAHGKIIGAGPHQQPEQPQYRFTQMNDGHNPVTFQASQIQSGEVPEKTGKKRGRPSKAERELREAEAARRGEVYQPMKRKPKAPKPVTTGLESEDDNSGLATSSKKTKTQQAQQQVQKQLAHQPDSSMHSPATPSQTSMHHHQQLGQGTSAPTFSSQTLLGMPEPRMRAALNDAQTTSYSGAEGLVTSGVRDQSVRQADMSMLHSPAAFGAPPNSLSMRADLNSRTQAFSMPGRPTSGDRGMPGGDPNDDRLRDYSSTHGHGHGQQQFSSAGYHQK